MDLGYHPDQHSYFASVRSRDDILMLTLQHPTTTMNMQMYALRYTIGRFEDAIRNFSTSVSRRKRAVYAFRKHDWFGEWSFAFPS
jgi:hypothetical protein